MSERNDPLALKELAGAMKGCAEALKHFRQRHDPKVDRVVRWVFRRSAWDASRHHDAMQDVWCHLLRRDSQGRLEKFVNFDPTRGRLDNWVGIKARDRAGAILRGQIRRASRELDLPELEMGEDVHDRYEARQDLRELERMLEQGLSPRELSVVILMKVQGLTGKEAAEVLETSENAVHKAMSRADPKLNAILQRFLEDDGDGES